MAFVPLLSLLVAVTAAAPSNDWLLNLSPSPVTATPWSVGNLTGITIANGLISRDFAISTKPGSAFFATWDFRTMLDEPNGESILRGLSPECTLGCSGPTCNATRAPAMPPNAFQLIATDAAATGSDCPNVGQGNTTSLSACTQDCWARSTCNVVNWATSGAPDCVLRACSNPAQPNLAPYVGFTVYATLLGSSNSTTVGGLVASPATGRNVNRGPFLNRTGLFSSGALLPDPTSHFTFTGNYSTGPIQTNFNWSRGSRGADPSIPWPPPGLRLTAAFVCDREGSPWFGVIVHVVYELYEGLPLLSKWVTVGAGLNASTAITLDYVTVEDMAVNPPFSPLASAAYPGNAEDTASGMPVYLGTGKLTAIVDMQYGTHVRVTNDVLTYGGAAGSTQPRLTAGDDAGLAFPLVTGAEGWTSVRLFLLLADDGPEQGAPVSL